MRAWRVWGCLMMGLLLVHPAGIARAAPDTDKSSARPLVTIIGELSYRERVALPVGASLLVTLSEQGAPAGPDAPTLARSRIDLAGQQVPLSFRLTAAAGRLKQGVRYALRAIIHDSQGRPLWSIQSAHIIDPDESLANLGTLWLTRASMAEPPATTGTEAPAAAAEMPADSPSPVYEARGYGPTWTLRMAEGQVDLVRFGTGRSEVARFSLPERQLLADGYRYVTRLGEEPLRVTINPGICLDERTSVPLPDKVTLERGEQVLQGCGGAPGAVLQEGEWRVETLSGAAPPAGATISMRFLPNGDVVGGSGCNRYIARYRADITGLTIASRTGASTLMTCPRELMAAEQGFLAALRGVQHHTMSEDGTLVLTGADDAEIRLRRVAGP